MEMNISEELKQMLSVVRNKELNSFEKYNKLIKMKEINSSTYSIKQIFPCKNLLKSSVSITSFIVDFDLFLMLEKENLLNFKDVKNIKTENESMSVIIPLLLLKNDITLKNKQLLLKDWIKKDKVIWNANYFTGYIEASSEELTNKKNGRNILRNGTNIFQMLAYFDCYETINYIINNHFYKEKQFKSLKSGLHSKNLMNAFKNYHEATSIEDKEQQIIKINLLSGIGDIAYPVNIFDMDSFAQTTLFKNPRYSEEVLIERMFYRDNSFNKNLLLSYLKNHIEKFDFILLKKSLDKHMESRHSNDLKDIHNFVFPYYVKKEKELLLKTMEVNIDSKNINKKRL